VSSQLNELLRDHGLGADIGHARISRLLGIHTFIANDFIAADIAKAASFDIQLFTLCAPTR
jgi:hypothetical protein